VENQRQKSFDSDQEGGNHRKRSKGAKLQLFGSKSAKKAKQVKNWD